MQVGVDAQCAMAVQLAQVRLVVALQAPVSYCVPLHVVHALQTRSLVALQAALWYWPPGQAPEHGSQLSATPLTR